MFFTLIQGLILRCPVVQGLTIFFSPTLRIVPGAHPCFLGGSGAHPENEGWFRGSSENISVVQGLIPNLSMVQGLIHVR